jgi:hypothetical protein
MSSRRQSFVGESRCTSSRLLADASASARSADVKHYTIDRLLQRKKAPAHLCSTLRFRDPSSEPVPSRGEFIEADCSRAPGCDRVAVRSLQLLRWTQKEADDAPAKATRRPVASRRFAASARR